MRPSPAPSQTASPSSEAPRYAVYVVPPRGSALAAFGHAVLGTASDRSVGASPALHGIETVSAKARVYGFHATLKAPMRLASGVNERDLLTAVNDLACGHPEVAVGRLRVAEIGAFLALVPVAPPPELGLLAAECVAALDSLRAPLSEAERARRDPDRLDARGRALLDRWGYPHVFEAFRFHMTLTDELAEPERSQWRARLAACYGTGEPLIVDALTVLRQDVAEPFRMLARVPFSGGRDGG